MGFLRELQTRFNRLFGKDLTFDESLRSLQPHSVWCLDFLKIEENKITVDGWALTPPGAQAIVTVNGFNLTSEFGGARPDLERLMHFDDRAPRAAFHAEGTVPIGFVTASDTLEIQVCAAETGKPFDVNHSFYWPTSPSKKEFPDPERRRRVHGDANLEGFIINGFSTFKKLSAALTGLSRAWGDFDRILDWGCGCGRVLRHLPEPVLSRLVGVDIDHDNAAWCERTFVRSEFHVVPLLPPTRIPAETFDLVIGISVFTHLQDQPQKAWLAELQRITRHGAFLLVTVHGPAAAARSNISQEQYRLWIKSGFLDTGLNIDLLGAIPDDEYYVNTLHTHSYVQKAWGKYFEIIAIHPASIANHQDLVVMRKR